MSGHFAMRGYVRFTPESGHVQCNSVCPLSANSGHCAAYSITASTRAKALQAGKDALESWDFKTMRRKERLRP
jgi:hypothetical protein